MDQVNIRAFWHHRQGLDGWPNGSPSDVLDRAGWARSVGGANPYLTLYSRAGISREAADAAAANLAIHELSSARGCTYMIPASDFGIALAVGRGKGESAEIGIAKRHLGVTDQEIDRLCASILDALKAGPLDPAALKTAIGDAVRNLGEAGKKKGITTTLALGLGRLQGLGEIRRKPIGGRLDQQRYEYTLWKNPPSLPEFEQALAELARRYFKWIGAASLANFQWFSGLSAKNANDALKPLGLRQVSGTDLLATEEDHDALLSFKAPKLPSYALVSGLDSMLLLRRDVRSLLDDGDLERNCCSGNGLVSMGGLQDVSNQVILDRGRIVGLWEFDSYAQKIVAVSFIPMNSQLNDAIGKTEAFIRDQLGDARSFSLDSPASRKPIIEGLRGMTA